MLLFAVLIGLAAPSDVTCAYDRAEMLALTPHQFNETLDAGWRPLGKQPACLAVAADLIAAYRTARWSAIRESELSEFYWHEGQLRAAVGQTDQAVRLLLAGVSPRSLDDAEDYALGTVAFLQRDMAALKAARDRMARLPEPAWFTSGKEKWKADSGHTPIWPPNLEVLDGLLACFDKPYAEAYRFECWPQARRAVSGG